MTGITKSQVSALCRDIDEREVVWSGPWRANGLIYGLDATYLKVRKGGRVVVGRDNRQRRQPDGRREILGLGLGDQRPKSLGGPSCALAPAGLSGVQLIISTPTRA